MPRPIAAPSTDATIARYPASRVPVRPARGCGRGHAAGTSAPSARRRAQPRRRPRPMSSRPSRRRTPCRPPRPPRAVAHSPSSSKKRCIAVGAITIGVVTVVPRTVVVRSMVDTSRSTWGSRAHRCHGADVLAERDVRAAPARQVLPRVRLARGLRGAFVRGDVDQGLTHRRMLAHPARSADGRLSARERDRQDVERADPAGVVADDVVPPVENQLPRTVGELGPASGHPDRASLPRDESDGVEKM